MDSSKGIPVEYKLDAFNMPRTGTTLCYPKIGYVDPTRNPALWASLMETNARLLPKLPDAQNYTVTLKFNPLTRPTTHAAISTFSTSHNSISSQYSQA